ncbi:MAG: Ca2+-dependent phosphoinositide-specific phospholipase C [Planctomycetaceae bacterium]
MLFSPLSKSLLLIIVVIGGTSLSAQDPESLESLPLSQIQCIGTHNSYHVAPDPFTKKFLASVVPEEALANDYSHAPIPDQLQKIGVRQLELDLYHDPRGTLFHSPALYKLAQEQNATVPPFDPQEELRKPGTKVLHSPDFDFRTTAYTLTQALEQIKIWSDKDRSHSPLFILLELKSDSFSPVTKPLAWDADALKTLEKEILTTIPAGRILRPDDVRGQHATLRSAITQTGWPTLAQTRGKIIFLLDNEDRVRDQYLQPSPTLQDRLLFVSVAKDQPAAAWMKRNDPVRSFAEIQALVKEGFLVRTRADSGLREARASDTSTREKAFASGAQLISTDFPQPDPRFPGYSVRYQDGLPLRKNVVLP